MKITENKGNFGSLFVVESKEVQNFIDITHWLRENNIQFVVDYPKNNIREYVMVNDVSIMAFKLRWM